MKSIKSDCNGNIITGVTAILIIATIITGIILLTTISYITEENSNSMANDDFKNIMNSYENDLNDLLLESIKDLSNQVIKSKSASKSSSNDIKEILNQKLDKKNEEYLEKYGMTISSEVYTVENTTHPTYIQSKIKISATKGNETYENVYIAKASVEGLKDPLPVLKCGKYPTFTYNETNVIYHESLCDFLKDSDVENPEGYIGATSPFIIRLCPYDPYIHHGDTETLKDCLEHGYYHESSDGSCYLCRLEGKGKCNHYGFEVFIQASENNITESLSASDHVVFHDQYPGERFYYAPGKSIFLDSSHRLKYGLS